MPSHVNTKDDRFQKHKQSGCPQAQGESLAWFENLNNKNDFIGAVARCSGLMRKGEKDEKFIESLLP